MAENKKSFVAYTDWGDIFDELSNEEAGILVKHLFDYVRDKKPDPKDKLTKMMFIQIKSTLKRDLLKFEKIKVKRSIAGKLSAKKREKEKQQASTNPTSVESVKQTSTNPTVSDSVNVSDSDIINNNKYKIDVIDDIQFMEVTCMQTNQNATQILKLLNTFEKHLIQIGENKKNLSEFKIHFSNWLRKQDLKKSFTFKKQRYV